MKDFNEFKEFIVASGKMDELAKADHDAVVEVLSRSATTDSGDLFMDYIRGFNTRFTFHLLEEYHKWLNE